mmetsp:Transcript_61572/g.199340  ORF Transcript_61572/g.199340 Transcript_61572/m.199340 type:complete len:261 (+) Transcript_61572:1424-2206(+)
MKKNDFCMSEIDKTKDEIKGAEVTKEDLEDKHKQLTNTLETLNTDIEELTNQEAEMNMNLKKAGEQRKQENQLFQASIMDQRATVNILNKALKRLQSFYAFAQIRAHTQEEAPGQAVSEKPSKPADYGKSAGAGGVLQLIAMIIKDAEAESADSNASEQHAQTNYAEMVTDATATIEAHRATRAEKSEQVAEAEADKATAEQGLTAAGMQLEKLSELLKAHHLECDFLLKFFRVRQEARAEEMDAITDAKAILSGANFGK